uniref:Caprin-2 n=1 Tax=Latimeria chalumnae TaxID=7897 RepID=M3XIU0_LATCH|nr:PREDICTED: caprin-2 isoform X2 [Latimeria chalumnae]|eukprot:XP_014347553.1 PREDICTED: caprin-2 isoform X2 [Latimeria chalumnae]
MVQLSPLQPLSPSGEPEEKMSMKKDDKAGREPGLFQAYENYIENGLICLKHKIRNMEKRKLKLEDYRDRLKQGDALNPDQLEAVDKYDEVIHNLEFAKDLQKTFAGLSQDLLKVQKKTLRREQMMRIEAEKKRFHTILQVQYVLRNLTQEHVQKDFRGGLNGAKYLTSKELDHLVKFSKLSCYERDESMSLEDQMEQTSLYFWDLLEGSEKPVAGTTYKRLKDMLSNLLKCGYFESIPVPHYEMQEEEVPEKKPVVMEPEKPRQLPKPRMMPKSEPIVEPVRSMDPFLQSDEIQPREFLNKRYLPEGSFASSKSPPEIVSWDVEYVETKQEKPKLWEAQFTVKKPEEKPPQPPLPLQQQQLPQEQRPFLKQSRAAGFVAKEQPPDPKNCVVPEPREKRERRPKIEPEVKQVPKPVHQPEAEFCSSSSLPKDPVLRRQKLQDLMAEIQGTCDFMQESVLESDRPSPSALPLSQRPSTPPPVRSPPASKEQRKPSQPEILPQSTQVTSAVTLHSPKADLVAADHTLSGSESDSNSPCSPPQTPVSLLPEAEPYIPPQQLYQASPRIPEQLPRKKSVDSTQAPISLPSDLPQVASPTTSMSPLPQGQVFPSAQASTSSIAKNTTPFQAMQTVFNMSAPVPSRNDREMKEIPYSPSYSQSFSTASTQTPPQCSLQTTQVVEQSVVVNETQQTVNPYQPEVIIPVTSGNLMFHPTGQQASTFPRGNQGYFSSRGSIRGAARGGRSLINSYRPANGFKGGFDGYRGPSPIIFNGSYGQPPFPAREYQGVPYPQRDVGYQQNYKRGGSSGPRANSRGWSDSSQVSSPERDNETFNSGDSGQGDSRSITPVDVPMTSQAATILPVHVYPLPQQMRVAFSAARTSNFTPGCLDQLIVFDLLLNNLGDSFDFMLGRFICPVSGTYVFIFHMLKLAVNVPLYVNLMKNDEVLVSAYANDGAPDHETASNHAVLQLLQGDQIWLRLHRGAIYGSSWKYSTFSGYLLYQD